MADGARPGGPVAVDCRGRFGRRHRRAAPDPPVASRRALGRRCGRGADSRRARGDRAVDVAQACHRRVSTGDLPQGCRVVRAIHPRRAELRLQRELGREALRRIPRSPGRPRCARSGVGRRANPVDLPSRLDWNHRTRSSIKVEISANTVSRSRFPSMRCRASSTCRKSSTHRAGWIQGPRHYSRIHRLLRAATGCSMSAPGSCDR